MFQSNFLLGLLFVFCAVQATPVTTNSDDELVYVFNIYAVRNMKTREIAKMIDQKPLEKVSAKFDPIGTFLIADPEDNEPFTLKDFGDFLEEWGATVEKLNEGKELTVIEVKFEHWEDYDEIFDIEELMRALRAEGIIMRVTQDEDSIIFEIELDETVKDPEDQPFTMKELAEYFRDEGFNVEAVGYDGVIKTVKIIFDLPEQATEQADYQVTEKHDRQLVTPKIVDNNDVPQKKDERNYKIDNSMDNAIDRSFDKKKDRKDEHFDDKFNMINFITRTRKRRSADACDTAECRVGNLIKEIVNKYERTN